MQQPSIRLNAALRKAFIEAVMTEIMPDEKEPSLEKFQTHYAEQVYDEVYGPILDTMKNLPKWATKKSRAIFVKLGNSDPIAFIMSTDRATFYHRADINAPLPVLDEFHPITKAYNAMLYAVKDWATKMTELRKQLTELAEGCNTTGQLFKTWPKALEFAGIFPEPEAKERTTWEPKMDASELDLGVALTQVKSDPLEEN